jgi:transcriptional regulator with XRE-family HTH domain
MVENITVQVKTTGAKIRTARAARDWTQNGLAAIARVGTMTVCRIENDVRVDEGELAKVLKALDLDG